MKKVVITSLIGIMLFIIYIFPTDTIKDYKENIEYIDAPVLSVYLIDPDYYVSRTDIIKDSDDIFDNIKYVINSLTKGSDESFYLPSMFSSIIPIDTKLLNYSLDDGILKLDFSSEFLNIEEKMERKMIEAITYSLCEFHEVNELIIFVEGVKLVVLPNSGEELPITFNKDFGVNKIIDITSFKGNELITTYYLSSIDDFTYYIPISKLQSTSYEKVEVIVKNLKTSPINQTNLLSYLKASVNLSSYEILEESVSLSFDNNLIADLNDDEILEDVKYALYLSIRDSYNVKSVILNIDNEKSVSVMY